MVLVCSCGVLLSGCDAKGPESSATAAVAFKTGTPLSWKLPKQLREVSGLASDTAGLVYAVADERAHVFRLDPASGAIVAVFGLGNPVVKGDFEGIALHDNWLYLITSGGRLLRTLLATGTASDANLNKALDGASRSFESFQLDTGCREIEGLAEDPKYPRLWIVCKEIASERVSNGSRSDKKRGGADVLIRLEAWSIDGQSVSLETVVELPLAGVLARTGQRKFKPSGLAFVAPGRVGDAALTADLLVISGAQRAYSRWRWSSEAQLLDEPQLLDAGRLPTVHRQPEGVVAGAGGSWLIADEGAGKSGRLRVYPQGVLQ